MEKEFPCPCCGANEKFTNGDYCICYICNWENDPVQLENPDFKDGANILSLNEAREKFNTNR